MRNHKLILACAAAVPAIFSTIARATITVDGSYDGDYGAPLAVQTNNTQFGDSTAGDGNSGGGSELDAIYGVVQGGNLDLLLTGNLENNNNNLDIFIADGRPGQNVINAAGGLPVLSAMNGSKFSPGFNATYALDINGGGSPLNENVSQYAMTQTTAPNTFFGSFLANDGAAHVLHGVTFSFNNTNAAGVINAVGTADQGAASAVQTGIEISIPLSSQLGNPSGGSIEVLADINGGNNGFLSNQFLPGLGSITGNLGTSTFDLSGTPGMFVSIPVPVSAATTGIWNLTTSGNWSSSASWSGGVPHLAGDTANFGTMITGNATVTLDGSETVGEVIFNNAANSYTIAAGSGTLTIDDGTLANPVISVEAGSHTIAAPVSLASGVTINTLDSTTLTVSSNISGTGDLTKTGPGYLALSVANSFSGNLNATAGTVELDNNNAASSGTITIGDPDIDNLPATLNIGVAGMNISNPITTNRDLADNDNLRALAETFVNGNATVSGTVTLNGSVVFISNSLSTLHVTGVIQDGTAGLTSSTHDIRVQGAGTVILTNVETNSGDTFVDSGTLNLAAGASVNSTNVTVAQGATMFVNGSLSSTANVNALGAVNFAGDSTGNGFTRMLGSIAVGSGATVTDMPSLTSKNPAILEPGTIGFADNTAKIDLTNNELITTTDTGTVVSQINGGNLVTSVSNARLGYADLGNGQVEIRATLAGDANLDGKVNAEDFAALAANYGTTSGAVWTQGDFDYNGTVDTADFNLLAQNFNGALASPALGALVPEPTMLGGAVLFAAALTRRRHRRI